MLNRERQFKEERKQAEPDVQPQNYSSFSLVYIWPSPPEGELSYSFSCAGTHIRGQE